MKYGIGILFFICVLGASPLPAIAQTVKEGIEKYKAGKYEEALKILTPFAENGNGEANTAISFLYLDGQGVEQDFKKSCDFLEKAYKARDPEGTYFFGVCYLKGQGRPQDLNRAYKLIKTAYDANYSHNNVAITLISAANFSENYASARQFVIPLALAGNLDAIVQLGTMLKEGFGFPVDHKAACDWYEKAANQKHIRAMAHLAECYRTGKGRPENRDKVLELIVDGAMLQAEQSK